MSHNELSEHFKILLAKAKIKTYYKISKLVYGSFGV